MHKRWLAAAAVLSAGLATVAVPHGAGAAGASGHGSVVSTRDLTYSLDGIPTPLTVTQVTYRTTNARGQSINNVTSVLHTPLSSSASKVVAYQSFYDSLDPADSPSKAIAGGTSMGGQTVHAETLLIAPALLAGYDVVVTDTEGPTADFAAGPEYGTVTLDALRAVSDPAAKTGVAKDAAIGMVGYSGGAIATNWAVALGPKYAPDVNRRIVGAAEGGVLVDPAHNLHYVDGSIIWAGVIPMALIGVARAYDIDLTPYLSDYGKQIYAKLQNAPISAVLGQYPGLTYASLAKPQYSTPEKIPAYVKAANKINLGSAPRPTVPMFIGQGANGTLEGTPGNKPGIGAGDGVMIAGDVRSLARQYCAGGTKIQYQQYDLTTHFTSAPLFLPAAYAYLLDRFNGGSAPSNCASIAPGNALTPIPAK